MSSIFGVLTNIAYINDNYRTQTDFRKKKNELHNPNIQQMSSKHLTFVWSQFIFHVLALGVRTRCDVRAGTHLTRVAFYLRVHSNGRK